MLLSIIVPVYNVEMHLVSCIESIYVQDLENKKYEVICVNDGSTDNSLKTLQILNKKHKNIKIISQKNQGLSGARNTGLNSARGKYILFVDSDDTIKPNILKEITEICTNNNLDILEFGAAGISENNKIIYKNQNSSNQKVLNGASYLQQIPYMSSACNKVYLLNFLNKNNLRFMEGVFIEDIEFNTRAVFLSKRIMAINTIMALFLQRKGSITRTKNFKKTEKMIFDIFTVLKSINEFTEQIVTEKSIAYIPLKKRVSSLISTMLLRVLIETNNYKIKNEIFKTLKKEKLYPTQYKAETKGKQLFLSLANNEFIFSLICYISCKINMLKS
ncbi:glycosyltransferase [Thalassobellus sediminis]|uniref:glycosyltransferase n=1 Tax=Thalassobellus sediminis TaxID=3367753 RepID=UPI0037A93D7A